MVSLADELVASDRPFASLVTLSLSKLKNLCCLLLLNKTMALSAAGACCGYMLCVVHQLQLGRASHPYPTLLCRAVARCAAQAWQR